VTSKKAVEYEIQGRRYRMVVQHGDFKPGLHYFPPLMELERHEKDALGGWRWASVPLRQPENLLLEGIWAAMKALPEVKE